MPETRGGSPAQTDGALDMVEQPDRPPMSAGAALASASAPVAVIVVNWNAAADTIACLDSLRATTRAGDRVYVVDNGSTDASARQIIAAHPEVDLVQAPRNLGYAGAFNLAAARALQDGAAYIWLLNNDTSVDAGTRDRLVAAARRHGPAIYSPTIQRTGPEQALWYAGGWLDWRLKSYHFTSDDASTHDDGVRLVAWATGCSLFCSAAVLRRVGPMDERYFLYLEDVDWCLRARALGVPTYCVPGIRIGHGVSQSTGRLPPAALRYYAWRNYYLLVKQHGRWWQRAYVAADLASRFVKIALRYLCFPAYRRDPLYRARTRGLVDVMLGRFGEYRAPARGWSVCAEEAGP